MILIANNLQIHKVIFFNEKETMERMAFFL